jgi:enoyl-CoA hydratase/carnithine racemase
MTGMSLLTYEEDGDLGILTLCNPPTNTFGVESIAALREALARLSKSSIRALLTRADGPNFCAGADVKAFEGLSRQQAASFVAEALELIHRIERLPIPTVVAVNGLCIAAGMELMLTHDIAIAADDAKLGQSEILIGTVPLAGGAQRIVARAGVARAKEIVYEGALHPAITMERWNIVNRVVPADKLQAQALAYAQRLAAAPTAALVAAKAMVDTAAAALTGPADQCLQAAAPAIFGTEDMQASVARFLSAGARAYASQPGSFIGR